MVELLLSVCLNGGRWHFQTVGSFQVYGSYAASGPFLSRGGSVGLSVPEKRTYRFDAKTKSVTLLSVQAVHVGNGVNSSSQADCDAGIISAYLQKTDDTGTLLSWDIETGRQLVSKPVSWNRFRRVGPLLDGSFNLAAGKTVEIPFSGWPVWANEDFVVLLEPSKLARQYGPYSVASLVDIKSAKPLHSQLVSPYEQGFYRIIGDPLHPPCAFEFGFSGVGVEVYSYSILKAGWAPFARNYPKVWDASPIGVLVSVVDRGYPSKGPRYPSVSFVDPVSEKVLWTKPAGDDAFLFDGKV